MPPATFFSAVLMFIHYAPGLVLCGDKIRNGGTAAAAAAAAANKVTVPFRIIGLMHYCFLSLNRVILTPSEAALVAERIHFNALLRTYALTFDRCVLS